MFRSNEFRIAFKKLFRGASIAPLPIEGQKKATCNQHGRQTSFLSGATEDVTVLSCRIPTSTEVVVEMTSDLP